MGEFWAPNQVLHYHVSLLSLIDHALNYGCPRLYTSLLSEDDFQSQSKQLLKPQAPINQRNTIMANLICLCNQSTCYTDNRFWLVSVRHVTLMPTCDWLVERMLWCAAKTRWLPCSLTWRSGTHIIIIRALLCWRELIMQKKNWDKLNIYVHSLHTFVEQLECGGWEFRKRATNEKRNTKECDSH